MGYTKLFSEILMSTIWREPDATRLVWITMLALRDRWHMVRASIPGLADAARVSMADCEEALRVLSSPDPYSRSKEKEGRRIKYVESEGWFIIQGEKWRNTMSLDERNEYQRLRQREYRAKKKLSQSCIQNSQQFTQTEEETKKDLISTDLSLDPDLHTNAHLNKKSIKNEHVESAHFVQFWSLYPRKVGKRRAEKFFGKLTPLEVERVLANLTTRQWPELRFVPYPTTYLNQARWEDETMEPEQKFDAGTYLLEKVRKQYER